MELGLPAIAPIESENNMKTQQVMKMPCVVVCCVFLLTTPLFARDSTDVIVMKNGDHLTGEIKGLNAGVLYVSMKYILGTSSVQWSEVARLESKQLFLVKTQDGSVYTGTLSTANTEDNRPMEIEVAATPGKEVVIERPRIIEMDMTSKKFFDRFNGEINTGVNYSKGNRSTQYSLSSEVSYPRERWGAVADFSSTLNNSNGVTASTRNQLAVDVFRLMRWNNWFYEGLGGFLQSSEQGISSQTGAGGGIGRYLKNTSHARVSVLGGLGGQNTNYLQNNVPQNLATTLIATNLQFFIFNGDHVRASTSVLMQADHLGRPAWLNSP